MNISLFFQFLQRTFRLSAPTTHLHNNKICGLWNCKILKSFLTKIFFVKNKFFIVKIGVKSKKKHTQFIFSRFCLKKVKNFKTICQKIYWKFTNLGEKSVGGRNEFCAENDVGRRCRFKKLFIFALKHKKKVFWDDYFVKCLKNEQICILIDKKMAQKLKKLFREKSDIFIHYAQKTGF